jgi:hypothetical protein
MADCCDHCNESSGSIKGRGYIKKLKKFYCVHREEICNVFVEYSTYELHT